MLQSIRHFLIAVQFFTRIPVTGRLALWVGFNADMLRASAAYFPAVGWVIGAIVAAFSAVLLTFLPTVYAPLVTAILGTALSVWLTGAFHEDGLADVADGLGGSYERDRALIIMKDSRVGAFGAIAVVLALGSKVAILALIGAVSPVWMCAGICGAHIVSRAWPLLIIRFMVHVGDVAGSKSKPLAEQISDTSLLLAALWLLTGMGAVITLQLLHGFAWQDVLLVWGVADLAACCAFLFMARLFHQRLQGFTGDCLGATQQVVEIAFYLGMALGLGAL